jgi:hypothetical protein
MRLLDQAGLSVAAHPLMTNNWPGISLMGYAFTHPDYEKTHFRIGRLRGL